MSQTRRDRHLAEVASLVASGAQMIAPVHDRPEPVERGYLRDLIERYPDTFRR